MDRRSFLLSLAAAATAAPAVAASKSPMGIATTSFLSYARPTDALEFLEYSAKLGAGGIQSQFKSLDLAYAKALRKRADELGMYVEVIAALPKDGNSETFERTLQAAKEAGAGCVRCACLSGRRYETFSTLADWKDFVDKSRDNVLRAASLADKYKFPLALENHKDWTSEEMVRLIKPISSEYVGVCLDTGNNISLLEEPMTVIEALAPYAIATHVKDMGVRPTADGFEMSEVVFGEGMLDMQKVITTIRKARPKVHITLEMITRDPLKIPCMTVKYWTTFPDRSGYALVKTLQWVKENASKELPQVSQLTRPEQLKIEEDNVRRCLAYANAKLTI